VTRNDSRDQRWPEVTRKWRYLTGIPLEVGVESRKPAYAVHSTSYKAVTRSSRMSRQRKWLHGAQITGSDLKVTSFDRKSPRSCFTRPKTGAYCTFHFLQGCSSQSDAVTLPETTSRDLRWRKWPRSDPEVTSFDWKLPGSGCRKPKTCVHCTFHFLQAVACSTGQSRGRKWCHVISGNGKWSRSDVIWPEVTWKWV